MKNRAKRSLTLVIAIIMLLSVVLSALVIPAFADADPSGERKEVTAVLTPAKGGATSIATMTFDDGLVNTARKLNELCAKYDAKASLVLDTNDYVTYDEDRKIYQVLGSTNNAALYVGNPTGTNAKAAEMNEILSAGYLDITSHSRNHIKLDSATMTHIATQLGVTEQYLIENEMEGSLADLKKAFPDYEVLTYGIPSSSLASNTYTTLYDNFYAARSGDCVLYHSSYRGKMQSVDPAVGNAIGSWYKPYVVRLVSENDVYAETNSIENIIGYLNTCVAKGGWFIGMAHGIVENENYDISIEELSQLMAKMQQYQNAGKLWVATYNEATKYIRERQNSTATAYSENGNYYVSVAMGNTTSDGLSLAGFDMPLTVKIEVPQDWVRVSYKLNGKDIQSKCVVESGKKYALVDVVPNGGEVEVTDATLDEERDIIPGGYELPAGAWNPASEENAATYAGITYAVWNTEEAFLSGEAPVYWSKSLTLEQNAIGSDSDGNTYYDFVNGAIASTTSNGKVEFTRYVHMFQDMEISSAAQIVTADAEKLTLNLGGNTLTMNNSFRVGGSSSQHPKASLTVKNGKALYKSGQTQLRSDTTFIMENVYMTVQYGSMYYAAQADFIKYKDCYLDIKSAASFSLGYSNQDYGTWRSKILFENTDIVYDPTVSIANLFTAIEYSGANNAVWDISFDSYSSLSGNVTGWLSLSESASYNATTETVTVLPINLNTINIEPGFKLASNIPFPTEYTHVMVDTDATLAASKAAGKLDTRYKNVTRYFGDTYAYVSEYTDTIAPGAFNPNDAKYEGKYDNILFGAWESESSFKQGNEPTYWYQNVDSTLENYVQGFNVANLNASGTHYVYCFGDVTNKQERLFLENGTKLTVNLGGHALVSTQEFVLNRGSGSHPGSYLVFENGKISVQGGTGFLRGRQDGSVVFRNVVLDATASTSGELFVDIGCKLVAFDHSVVRFSNKSLFLLDDSRTEPYRQSILFLDTDFYQVDTDQPLFKITNTIYGYNNWSIVFDKNSTITRNSNYWMQLIDSSTVTHSKEKTDTAHFYYTQGLYFEVGVKVSKAAYPTYSNSFIHNGETFTSNTEGAYFEFAAIKPSGNVTYSVTDGSVNGLTINLNRPKDTAEVKGFDKDAFAAKLADGTYIAADECTVETVDGYYRIKAGKWIPDASYEGILYGVWKSETDYIAGIAPDYWYQNTDVLADNYVSGLDTDTVGTYDTNGTMYLHDYVPGYVRLYQDTQLVIGVKSADKELGSAISQLVTGKTQKLVIDLGGYTLQTNKGIRVGGPSGVSLSEASLTIKNGSLVVTDGQIQPRMDTTLIFEDLDIEFNSSPLYDAGFKLLEFRGCNINLNHASAHFMITTVVSGSKAMNFIDTDLVCTVARTEPLFVITGGIGVDVNKKLEINFDKNSSLVHSGETFVTLNRSPKADGTYGDHKVAHDINFEVGCVVSTEVVSGQYKETFYNFSSPDVSLHNLANYQYLAANDSRLNINFIKNGVKLDNWYAEFTEEGLLSITDVKNGAIGEALKVNLTLFTDFNVNFFADPDVVVGVYNRGELLPSENYGELVKYVMNLAADKAADNVHIGVAYKYGDAVYYVPTTYSVLTYAEQLMAGEYSAASKDLAKAAVAYIKKAYEAAGAAAPAKLTAFDASVTPKDAGTTQLPESLTAAISGAQLYLDFSTKLVLNLKADFNGIVKVNGVAYEVAEGALADGSTFVAIELKAKELLLPVTVEANGDTDTAEFTLAGYVNTTEVQESNMKELVEALYTYAVYANEYAAYVEANGGVMN